MKKIIIALITLAFTSTSSIAGPKIEVLHWWTSGGEAAALKVLKDDFAANGGEWLDMPVTGGGVRDILTRGVKKLGMFDWLKEIDYVEGDQVAKFPNLLQLYNPFKVDRKSVV